MLRRLRGKLFDPILDSWKAGKTESEIGRSMNPPMEGFAIRRIIQRARSMEDPRAVRRKRRGIQWERKDFEELRRLEQDPSLSPAEIAAILGRSEESVQRKLRYIRAEDKVAVKGMRILSNLPGSVAEEWERKLRAVPRDLTGSILKDPPIGYSALECRSTASVEAMQEPIAEAVGWLNRYYSQFYANALDGVL